MEIRYFTEVHLERRSVIIDAWDECGYRDAENVKKKVLLIEKHLLDHIYDYSLEKRKMPNPVSSSTREREFQRHP